MMRLEDRCNSKTLHGTLRTLYGTAQPPLGNLQVCSDPCGAAELASAGQEPVMMPLEDLDLEMADAMAEAEAAKGDPNSQPNSQTGRNGSTVSTGAEMADVAARV